MFRITFRIFIVGAFVALTTQCSNIRASSDFGERQDKGVIEFDAIREASGIVASRNNPGVLWVHNDSGKRALYAINSRGEHLGVYKISGCKTKDWEDIAIGAGERSGESYIYIGAIGDNHLKRKFRSICRITEPKVDAQQKPVEKRITVDARLDFKYPGSARADAEALMLDPQKQVLYLINKRSMPATVYELPIPKQPRSVATAKPVATLPYRFVVAADMSADGREILIKTYTNVYYWKRLANENLSDTLKRPPTVLPYRLETQGEAIGWADKASGYFTVSEENIGIDARLYFYPRK